MAVEVEKEVSFRSLFPFPFLSSLFLHSLCVPSLSRAVDPCQNSAGGSGGAVSRERVRAESGRQTVSVVF